MYTFVSRSLQCLFLLLVASTLAVDIEISPRPDGLGITLFNIQRCRDIPPGHCCQSRPAPPSPVNVSPPPTGGGRTNRPEFVPPPAVHPNKRIVFTGLDPRDIAAAFADNGPVAGCRERPKATYSGGGRWLYEVPIEEWDVALQGGSWVRMPLGPPDQASLGWVEAESVRGFVWESGSWFGAGTSSEARSTLLGAANAQLDAMGKGGSGHPMGWKVKRLGKRVVDLGKLMMGRESSLERRTIRSPNKGVAFCAAPKRRLWPDVIVMDGVEYRSETPQSPIYIGGDGSKVLNYTSPAS
ncbi:MAG: hypothetical protein Q9209_006500 [Squamulea sp. 1 TL-2023]